MEIFHDVTYQTSHGQLLDLITAPIGQRDLGRYTIDTYMRIVTYKTAFYTFFLPVACGMFMAGFTEGPAYSLAEDLCVQMGQYFQVPSQFPKISPDGKFLYVTIPHSIVSSSSTDCK